MLTSKDFGNRDLFFIWEKQNNIEFNNDTTNILVWDITAQNIIDYNAYTQAIIDLKDFLLNTKCIIKYININWAIDPSSGESVYHITILYTPY